MQKIDMQKKVKNSLSVAIIVKNAESTIFETINSVKDFSHQIVVVDTGSTDKTTQICTRLGAEVYFFKWQNDFSIARNYALNFVRNDWVLVIDSDEILDIDSFINRFDNLVYRQIGGIRVLIKNYIQNTDTIKEHTYPRIFRNSPYIRFTGKIHEQISESIIQEGYEIIDSDIIINHFGYFQNDEQKINRNLIMLKQEVDSDPYDDWKIYHLAETEFTAGNFEKSYDLFSKILDSVLLSEEQNDMVRIRLGQLSLRQNKFEEVATQLNFTSNVLQLEGLRKYILASSCIMMKNFKDADHLLDSSEVKLSELISKHDLQNVKSLLVKLKEQGAF